MNCRPHCGACCIAPSISSPIPDPMGGSPQPKPAGVPCPQLDEALRCRLFGHPSRPAVCRSLQPHADMCGTRTEQAMHTLTRLEWLTPPLATLCAPETAPAQCPPRPTVPVDPHPVGGRSP